MNSPLARPGRSLLVTRATALAVLLTAGSAGVLVLTLPPLRVAAAALRAGHQLSPAGFAGAACAAALTAGWLWCLAVAAAVAAGAVRSACTGAALPTEPSAGPRVVQVLVLAVLGLGATVAPSSAAPSDIGCEVGAAQLGALSGLPLPDRAPSLPSLATQGPATRADPAHAAASSRIRVRAGDSLWLVARGLLPAGASAARIDRTWRLLAAANPRVVGRDPDLIFPGTVLRVPALDTPAGKDLS